MDTPDSEVISSSRGGVIDFDNHYYEAEDCYLRHIDPKDRDLALVPKGERGRRLWTIGDRPLTVLFPGFMLDTIVPAGSAAQVFSGGNDFSTLMDTKTAKSEDPFGDAGAMQPPSVRVEDFPDWQDRKARLKQMDEQGLQTILIIPSQGLVWQHDFRDHPAAVCANSRAFNRWVEEDWGFGADGRIFAVPILSLVDLDWAVEELQSLAERGSRFFWLSHTPVNGKSPADPTFDPFWSRVEEIGMKPVFHVGFEGFGKFYGAHWGENPDRNLLVWSAMQHYIGWGERPICDMVAALVLHNLFGRFPGIEIVSIENGSAWVPSLLRQMNKAAKIGMRGEWLGGPLTDLPSEIFRHHFYINPYHEEEVRGLVEVMGPERVLFGSDYPHPEGLAEPLQDLSRIQDELSVADADKFLFDNAASLLGLPT